jgi:hypothetical protein
MTSFRELSFEPAGLTERDIQRLFNVFNHSLSAQYLSAFIKSLEYTGLFSLTSERLSYTLTKTIEYGEKLIDYWINTENQLSIEVIDFWKQSILTLQAIVENPPVNSVTIDFGNLEPVHINYISDAFEIVNFFNARQWKHDFFKWLNANILKKNQVAVLEKCLLYSQRRYLYYQGNECNHGENCPNRKMFEDKIEYLYGRINEMSTNSFNGSIVVTKAADKAENLGGIFNTDEWRIFIDALVKAEPPHLDSNWCFIGERGGKGVVCSWIKELQYKGIVKPHLIRSQLASILNTSIPGINIGKDAKTFDNQSKLYEKQKNSLLTLAKLLP